MPSGKRAVVGVPRRTIARWRTLQRPKWSQSDLARHAGVDQSTISLIEAGKSSPSGDTLRKLAAALGIPLDAILF